MVSRTAQPGLQTTGGVASSLYANSVAGGWIGYVEKTDVQGPGFASETAVAGLTVTVTVNSSRRIEVRAYVIGAGNTAGDLWAVLIKEGSTQLQIDRQINTIGNSATSQMTFRPSVILTPSAGSHTYFLTMTQSVATGNATVRGSATQPNWIMVVDLGAA